MFAAVVDISNVPIGADIDIDTSLSGTVTPAFATDQTIIWSVKDGGGTGASITGSTFHATSRGKATITATIQEGDYDAAAGKKIPYTKDFVIAVGVYGLEPIRFREEDGEKQYSTDDGSSWLPYTGSLRFYNDATTAGTITVESGTHDITLAGINISTTKPLIVSSGATLNLTLEDGSTNTLTGTGKGSYANEAVSVLGTLNIDGGGSLTANSGPSSAGIYVPSGGVLHIKGGTVTANGANAAGIGNRNGEYVPVGTILISGGVTTANGDDGSAGIGLGQNNSGSSFGTIEISGGTVIANGAENWGGDGIGIGKNCTKATGSVLITGGTVTAVSRSGDTAMRNVTISPAVDKSITIRAGANATDAAEIDGSPFTANETGYQISPSGVYFKSESAAIDYAITVSTAEHGSFTVTDASGSPASLANYGDTLTITPTPDNGYQVSAVAVTQTDGTGAVTAEEQEDGSYTFTMPAYPVTVAVSFALTPAEVPVINSVTGAELTYGYGADSGSVSVSATVPAGHTLSAYQWYENTENSSSGGAAIPGAAEATYPIPAGKKAGTYYYYCVVTAKRDDNGETASAASNAAAVTVSRRTPAISDFTFTAPQSLTYDGGVKLASVSPASGIDGMGTVEVKYFKDGSEVSNPAGAGTYTVKIDVAEGDNYSSAADLTDAAWTFIVARAMVTITAADKSAVIGEPTPDLSDPVAGTDYTVSGLVGEDTLSAPPVLDYLSTPDMTKPGRVGIVPSGGSAGENYTIEYANGVLTIDYTVYSISYDLGGGALPDGQSNPDRYTQDSAAITLVNPVRSNYSFTGWSGTDLTGESNMAVTISTGSTGDRSYTAHWQKNSSGGGGGSSSGSSHRDGHSSTTAVTPPATVERPNPPVIGVITPSATVNKDGKVIVSVPDSDVKSAIEKAQSEAKRNGTTGNGIAVRIDLTGIDSKFHVLPLTLSKDAYRLLVDANVQSLDIETKEISLSLDLRTMETILAHMGNKITISAEKADRTKLSDGAKAALGSRPVYDLKIANGEVSVSDFGGGSVTVTLPYQLAANEKPGGVYGIYVDAGGGVNWLMNSSYDQNAKALRFKTSHFSIYGVGYKAPPAFTDTANHWAKDDIEFVAIRGLLNGTSATTFTPDGAMTRGMFVTALGRLAGIDPDSYKTGKFTDVQTDAYYAPYVNWAAEKGIVSGTSATTFAPEENVTRQQMAAFMQNYAEAMGYTLPKTHEAVTFADSASIADWAAESVRAMQMAGVIMGKDKNCFDPTGTATRAEAAAVLRRYVELVIDPARQD